MFIVLISRTGLPHIYNYMLSNGKYRTLCGLNMPKENVQNTLCGDGPFPGVCPNCFIEAEDMYLDDLKMEPRIARNQWQMRLESLRDYHYQEILGPTSSTYEMISRHWDKLTRAKSKLNRHKKKK